MTKSGSNCYRLSLKAPEEDKEEKGEEKEGTVSLAAGYEIADTVAEAAAVLSNQDGVFTLTEEQRMALEALLHRNVFSFNHDFLWQESS